MAGLIWKKSAKKIQLERHILLGRRGFKWISSVIDEHPIHMQGRACKGITAVFSNTSPFSSGVERGVPCTDSLRAEGWQILVF